MDTQGESFLIRAIWKILLQIPDEQNDQFWLKATRDKHTATAGAYGLISVKDASDNK
ncbi:hypothetical protein [Bacillus solitudinis]|uniref:hypothetical protein n=1 Tax=Bacillus solitudinis TaxID=2014074 RepID=UPI0012FD9E0C|nr:hypothetical protein [Bacillus solitudinis]